MSQQPPPPGPPEGWDRPSGEPTHPQGQGWGQQPPGSPYGQPTGRQPAGWGPGPAAGTQQPPKKSRGRTFAIGCLGLVGLLVLLGIVAALAGGGDDGGTQTAGDQPSATRARNTTKTTAAPAPEVAGIGDPVRDGKFEFTVTKAPDCSRTEIGDQFTREQAQGKFCIIAVKVKNIGREAQALSASDQYVYDGQGNRYSSSDSLWVLVSSDSPVYEDINPGNTRTARMVFDIPKSVKPAKIELHDSPFSGGVTVEL